MSVEGAVRWRTAALLALAALIPLVFFAAVSWFGYRDALAEGRKRLEGTSRVGVEHLRRVIETNEVIARGLLVELSALSPERAAQRERHLHDLARRMAEGLPQIQSVWVWDREGRPLASSLFYPVPESVNVRDREYFVAHEQRGARWYVSPMLLSRTTGEPFFDISRRWDHQGSFAGVISVSLRPEYFVRYYARLAEREPGLALALVRRDGEVVARAPEAPAGGRRLRPDSPVLAQFQRDAVTGFADGISSVDGVARVVAFVRSDDYPLYVVSALERGILLRGWQADVAALAAFVLPATLALVWMLHLALRRAEREAEAYRRLQAEVEQRARAEEALRHAQKLEALGLLTGGVAHDFNNLLMVLNNHLHLLRLKGAGEAQRASLEAMGRAVQSGTQLTRQLLAFARRQPLMPVVVDPGEAVQGLRELLQTVLTRTVDLQVEVAEGVPSVRVDPGELELALINLVMNARDALPQGGLVRVVVRKAESGDVLLEVIDNGAGIPPAIAGKVFEPFFTTKPPGQGTGLGLAQVYGFCRQAGGGAEIRGREGGGTVVTLRLPASEAAAAPASVRALAPRCFRARVLLVEDHPDIARTTAELLRGLGCTVVTAVSGEEGLAVLGREAGALDAVLTDIVMPGALNGLALARQARERWPQLPVVLMTGYSSELESAVAEGYVVLPKPVDPGQLAQTLSAFAKPAS